MKIWKPHLHENWPVRDWRQELPSGLRKHTFPSHQRLCFQSRAEQGSTHQPGGGADWSRAGPPRLRAISQLCCCLVFHNWSVTLLSCSTAVLYHNWTVCTEWFPSSLYLTVRIHIDIELAPITIGQQSQVPCKWSLHGGDLCSTCVRGRVGRTRMSEQ